MLGRSSMQGEEKPSQTTLLSIESISVCFPFIACCFFSLFLFVTDVFAQVPGYAYQEVSTKGNFFRLITGGLGSFVMFFMGLGGVASLFLTRRGSRGEGVSLYGVAMLLIAIGIFGLRVLIQAGALGHEYIEW